MQTAAPASLVHHVRFRLSTRRPTEFVDVTERIARAVDRAGLGTGVINVQTLHTTTAIVVNEHEPLLLDDLTAMLERIAPRDAVYRHDDYGRRTVNLTDAERTNGHAHCQAAMLPSCASLNVCGGSLVLGRWQRVFFVELDGPQERELSIVMLGEALR